MTASRVSGPTPPEPNKGNAPETKGPSQHKKVDAIERTSGVDPDQKRRRFQQALDQAEKQLRDAKGKSLSPSPFSSSFHLGKEKRPPVSRDLAKDTPPAQTPSRPPDTFSPPPPQPEEEASPSSLPLSRTFWNSVDEPPDREVPSPKVRETAAPTKPEGKKKAQEEKKEKEDLLSLPHAASPLTGKPVGKAAKKEEARSVTPQPREQTPAPSQKKSSVPPFGQKPPPLSSKEEKSAVLSSQPLRHKKKGASPKEQHEKEALRIEEKEREERRTSFSKEGFSRDKEKEKEKKSQVREDQPWPPLPTPVISQTQEATFRATPYLSPETLPLFYQMVGTIYVMTASGVTKTEVILNSPAFANSRFAGAKITVEKDAAAPNFLRVTLTGPTRAVTAFNQHLPNLEAAFQNSKFPFRVRIETAYEYDRPVFRRRDSKEKREDASGGFEDQEK